MCDDKSNIKNKYLRPEEATKLLKVSNQTLVNWDNEGKINCIRTKGKHRRYLYSDLIPFIPNESVTRKDIRRKICYCRVSTASQKEDLERQVEYFRGKYPDHEVIKDIGSGINFKRKGFNSILDSAVKGNISEVVVTHKDRLCRFGFDLIERIITDHSNGKILVLDKRETSPQEELINDLISIITVFSSRIYGLRSHGLKQKISALKNNKDKVISHEEREGNHSFDV